MMTNYHRYLVTGGAGFVGSHLVESLVAKNAGVVVIDNLSTGRLENLRAVKDKIELVTSSVQRTHELHWIVSSVDAVIHLAATVGVSAVMRSPVQTIRNNHEATDAVVDAVLAYGKPIVFASTSEVYGLSKDLPYKEDGVTSFGRSLRWGYAVSKLHDEFYLRALAQERGLTVRIARLFNTVGPRQVGHYGMVLPRFVHAALRNEPLRVYGDGQQTRTFVHVSDVVRGLITLADGRCSPHDVTVNLGGDEEITIRALAERVVRRLGSKSRIEHVNHAEVYGHGFEDMPRRVPSISYAMHAFAFAVTADLDTIIDDVAQSMNAERLTVRPARAV